MYGKRVEKESNPIPDWVMNGTSLVKREFIAGFQGGDGSKIFYHKRSNKVKAYSFKLPWTIQHKCPEHADSLFFFMAQLGSLFTEFGIEIRGIDHFVESETRNIVRLNFSAKEENIIKYMDTIGYRYATTKSTISYHVSEYLKYKQNKIQERVDLKNKVIQLTSKGLKPSQIAKQIGIRVRLVTSIQEYQVESQGYTLAPKDCMGFEEWLKCTKASNNCVMIPIKTIEPHPHCMVSDFTTESDNHSFIANNICVGNCGLVKNLAITTRMSLDRGIEGDRIILNMLTYGEQKSTVYTHVILLNSKYIGWCNGPLMREKLINARRAGELYYDISFYLDELYFIIDSSPSRLISPVLIVDKKTQQLVLDLKQLRDFKPLSLIKEGAMEYISALEEKNLKIAVNPDDLQERINTLRQLKQDYQQSQKVYLDTKRLNQDTTDVKLIYKTNKNKYLHYIKTKPYTHCEISGRVGFGVAADMIPYIGYNQGPRNVYQAAMGTQAVSIPFLNYKLRFDNTLKLLEAPTQPIVKTDMYDTLGLTDRGMGANVIVAIAAYPFSEEDSIIFNQGAIDRGLFRMVKYFTVQGQIKISDPLIKSYFGKPELKPGQKDLYKNLNEYGLPIIGSYVDEQECVLGIIKEKNGIKYDSSVYLNYGERGIVDDIIFHETDTFEFVTVRLRITRLPKNGDKYAARYAQKGTIYIYKEDEMPFSESTGIIPDVIINPTVIPSRMTVSYLNEILSGKAGACCGDYIDASAFEEFDKEKYEQILLRNGYEKRGYEVLREGKTGQKIKTAIFMGVVYFQALKHQPEDKIGVRSLGPKTGINQQAVKGRSRGGGGRYGTMEVDTLLSHGAGSTTKERLCDLSDKYKQAICKECGMDATFNTTRGQFYCQLCQSKEVGALTIPYVDKYQRHLLGAMGIKKSYGIVKPKTTKIKVIEEVKKENEGEEEDEENEEESEEENEDNEEDSVEEEYDAGFDEDVGDEEY
jgi:hypothetical protein